jgi:hypothetical protein
VSITTFRLAAMRSHRKLNKSNDALCLIFEGVFLYCCISMLTCDFWFWRAAAGKQLRQTANKCTIQESVSTPIFWDTSSPFPSYFCLVSWLLQLRKCRQHVPTRCRLTFTGLQGFSCQERAVAVATAVRASDPTKVSVAKQDISKVAWTGFNCFFAVMLLPLNTEI